MEVPGKVGWPIVGDKSVDFYRDPLKFLDKNRESCKSQLFRARFLNRPTVFVCSSDGVQDVLNNQEDAFELGYEAFMGSVYGHNILFLKNEDAVDYRHVLAHYVKPECICNGDNSLKSIVDKNVSDLSPGEPFCLYKFFKKLFTEICLTLFLGLDFSESKEIAETIISLTAAHWKGIVAVPLDLRVPVLKSSSTYGKAIEAKERLLEVINSQKQKAKSGLPPEISKSQHLDESAVDHHLLLFTSALIPKVLASICTSLCIETGHLDTIHLQNQARENTDFLQDLLLETQRLHPPLLGGRRLARKSCIVAGYNIPKDYAVVFMTYTAQRDPSVFENPEQFMPERWAKSPELKEKLFVYGLGPRACIGQKLSWLILKTAIEGVMQKFSWEICQDQAMEHKHIPVCRPKSDLMARVTPV